MVSGAAGKKREFSLVDLMEYHSSSDTKSENLSVSLLFPLSPFARRRARLQQSTVI